MPRISVILSSYNHERYIAEAIQSVLDQSYQDFELLIYDDGSDDQSAEIIRSFHDARIHLFLYEKNRGALEAAREAFSAASGEYIAVHHSDDVWKKDKLQKQVAFLDAHREYAACFTLVDFIDERSQMYDLSEGHVYLTVFQQENRSMAQWLRNFFEAGNGLCHPSLLIRREMYAKYGLLEQNALFQLPDAVMWVKLLCGGEKLYVYQEKLTCFRLRRNFHHLNTSAESPANTMRTNFEYLTLLEVFLRIPEELFQEAFPEYAPYVLDGDIRFAFGKLCIASELPAFRVFGLNLLHHLVCMPKTADTLQRCFHYGVRDFAADSGRIDCFQLKTAMHFAQMMIIPDYGQGYFAENAIHRMHYIQGNGNFTVHFDFSVSDTIYGIRFDPDDGVLVRVCIHEFAVNGKQVSVSANGVLTGSYYIFEHGDPIFTAAVQETGVVHIFIRGVIQYPDEMEKIKLIQQKSAQLEQVQSRLAGVLHSRCWRYTAFFRAFMDWIRHR